MLKLLIGRAATGKTTALLQTIAQAGALRPQVLIVPEQHSHDMERRLCAVAGNAVSLHAEVLSFTRLAGRVFSTCGGVAEPMVDAGGRLLLLDMALRAVAQELRLYARPSRRPEFLSQLSATVDECKAAGLRPEKLYEIAQSLGGEGIEAAAPDGEKTVRGGEKSGRDGEKAGRDGERPGGPAERAVQIAQSLGGEGIEGDGRRRATADKLYDLSLILGSYESLAAQRGADPRDRLARLAEALETCPWAADKDIYLDGFTDFTWQERQVLQRLLAQANTVTVALTCDSVRGGESEESVYDGRTDAGEGRKTPEGLGRKGYRGVEDDVFAPARRTARRLLAMAKEARIEVQVETRQAASCTEACNESHKRDCKNSGFLKKNSLFEAFWPVFAQNSKVRLYRSTTPYSEVERAAAEIVRLAREEGYRWRDISVTARTMEGYGPLIERVFPRYGVPVFLARMDDVLQKPVLTLVTAALDAVAGGYRYEDMFRYLKTGLAGLTLDEVDRLENYVLKWEPRGSAWTQKKPWDRHPEGYGVPWTDGRREEVTQLDALRRKAAEPLEKLRLAGERTGSGLALALYGFLEEIGLARRLSERAEALREGGEGTLAAEYEQLWDILCAALEQSDAILGDTPMDQEEFARLFKLVLSQYQVGAIPVSLDAVTVGEMPRLAHKHCRALFILGADDAQLPAAAPSPGLISDDDREVLAAYGLESAPRRADKLWRELTIVYETCSLPSERLMVSYPGRGAEGEERRPSFLVKRLREALPELKLETEEALGDAFRLAAPRPALDLAGRCPEAARALRELPDYAPLVERMERARSLERGSLTRPAVEALYGRRVPMSASRMDLYKSCHFSYFMRYGLRARPRRSAGFQAPEYGTFVHYVLEHALREREGREIPTRERVSAVVERYIQEELGGLEKETPRFRYLFRRLEKSVYAVVENVCQELSASQFQPVAFELGFGGGKDLPPVELTVDGFTVSVSGFVDRVDGWVHDGRLYLRVVDYKTGRKSFDLTDVWNGLGLQMLLYLFTLKEEGREIFGGGEIVPAGVLYLPARDAVISGRRGMTEEERRRELDKQLHRRGLVLDDPAVVAAMEPGEDGFRFLPVRLKASGELTGEALVSAERLGRLERHTRSVLEGIAGELAAGNIAADPFWRGPRHNACQWCDYAAACQFREGRGGDRKRWLPSVKAQEFWARLEDPKTGGEDHEDE